VIFFFNWFLFSEGEKKADDAWEQELQQTLDSYEVVDGDVGDNELDLELGDDRKIA
jgi:hypothetical protein